MAWWEWLLLALFAIVVVGAIGYLAVRSTKRGRRFLGLPLADKARFARALLRDPEIPLIGKGILLVLVVYLAMPFDLVPDFVPVLGQLDDAFIGVVAILWLLAIVPGDRFDAALTAVEEPANAYRSPP